MRAHLVAAACALAAAISPATAVPEAQEVLTAHAVVYLAGADRATYQVRVMASLVDGVATTQDSAAYLWISRCAPQCPLRSDHYYSVALTPEQYDVRDDARVSIRLSAFGKPFAVTWTATEEPRQTTNVMAGGTMAAVSTSSWRASAAVTILGRSCADRRATAGRGHVVYLEGRPDPGPATRPAQPPPGLTPATGCRAAPA